MPKVSDEHKEERRRQILEGARRAFARYGYERATVVRLEQEIGLSRGAIFSYFPDKWAIFFALAEEDYARAGELWIREGFRAVIEQMVLDRPDWLGVYFELTSMLRTNPELRAQWSARNPEIDRRLLEHIVGEQRAGRLRDDLEPAEIARFLGVILDGVTVHVTAGFPPDLDLVLKLVNAAIRPE